jgi:probable HAF family extracellular repeat protein
MKRVSHVISVVAVILVSAILAAAPRLPAGPVELGFPADIANINNRGDVVSRDVLWAAGELIPLGPLPDETFLTAFAVNQRREVVGWAVGPSGIRGFLWQNGVTTDLGTLGGSETTAFDINSRGQVLGVSETPADGFHGFIWRDGAMRDIGRVAFVGGINNRGQAVGGSFASPGSLQAFIWTKGRQTHLGTLPGASNSTANDINDGGQVVGQSEVGDSTRAFLWEGGAMIDLGTLPGGTSALAYRINNRGQVVGWGNTATGETHGILWQNGTSIDLGTLPGGSYSFATGINERGDIVGASQSGEQAVAVLWTARRGRTGGSD